jgi:hypothetical protein
MTGVTRKAVERRLHRQSNTMPITVAKDFLIPYIDISNFPSGPEPLNVLTEQESPEEACGCSHE